MSPRKATLIVLLALSLSALGIGASNAHAGSYTWGGQGGGGLTLEQIGNVNTFTPIRAPTSMGVGIDYDSSQLSSPITTGYTSRFGSSSGFFNIGGSGSPLWRGFFGEVTSVTITAPPPGGGLDTIEFDGTDGVGGRGGVVIYAPNGTLSTSFVAPATLDAFENYGIDHFGTAGSFGFAFGGQPGLSGYLGVAEGVLGVPEPPAFVPMSIGRFIVFGVVAINESKRRNAPNTKPASNHSRCWNKRIQAD